MKVAGVELHDPRPVSGGDICRAVRATTADGRPVFAKTLDAAPDRFFAAEADGLAMLRVPGGPPVPDVVAVGADGLVLSWVEPGRPRDDAAEAFGRALAALHRDAPPSFGAQQDGFIGSLPLPNTAAASWPELYAESRLRPFLAGVDADTRGLVERVCDRLDGLAGPAEPPARVHGDLWSGNVLWSDQGEAWVVDAAAAHGGHRETDLAMLALFGAPHLEAILAAYDEELPLAEGWRERVALHQLHPLLVHATLFGGSYVERVRSLARRLV